MIDYVKLKFREVLSIANLVRIEVGLIMQIKKRLMTGVQNIFDVLSGDFWHILLFIVT